MYKRHSNIYYTKEQRFNDKFPISVVATLAIVQMLTTFVIFALELGHNILHVKLTNLFVGFWTAIPFTILWISMFAIVCCCRRRSCASHAVVQNIFGFIFACILIALNINFIREPNKCFFSNGLCQTLSWTSYISEPFECLVDGVSAGCGYTRIFLILGQLGAGILMAITCLIYLIVYYIIYIRVSKSYRTEFKMRTDEITTTSYPMRHRILPIPFNHHHQSYTLASYPYQEPIPVMMAFYQPQTSIIPSDFNFNHMSLDTRPTKYPALIHERF